MKPRLNDDQVAFWRQLLAPFPPEALSEKPGRGGKPMTWLDKRSLANRLDSVCGPHGWYPEYEATQRGYKCRLHILCPMDDGRWEWVHKEDGAGFEEMDAVDDDEKSGYTNAMRRAAQDAWGIGRYLYRKGIPDFLDPNAGAPPRLPVSVEPPAPQPPKEVERRFEYADIPRPGTGVFPWVKEIEKHFHEQLWVGMKAEAERRKFPAVASQWTKEQVDVLASNLIRYVKTIQHYKGEFDATPLAPEDSDSPDTAAADQHVAREFKAAKSKLVVTVKALVNKQLGKPGTDADIKAVLKALANCTRNGKGELGLNMESLLACEDWVWVGNMQAEADAQVKRAVTKNPDVSEDDIPF